MGQRLVSLGEVGKLNATSWESQSRLWMHEVWSLHGERRSKNGGSMQVPATKWERWSSGGFASAKSSYKLIPLNDIHQGLEAGFDTWRQAIKLEWRTEILLVTAQSSLTSLLTVIFSVTSPGLHFCSHERCCQCPAFCLRLCRILESCKTQRAVYLTHFQTALVRWSPASPVNGFGHYHGGRASGTGRSFLPWRGSDQNSSPNWAVWTVGWGQTHSSNTLTQNAWQNRWGERADLGLFQAGWLFLWDLDAHFISLVLKSLRGECSVSHLPLCRWNYTKCIRSDKAVGIDFGVASAFLNCWISTQAVQTPPAYLAFTNHSSILDINYIWVIILIITNENYIRLKNYLKGARN